MRAASHWRRDEPTCSCLYHSGRTGSPVQAPCEFPGAPAAEPAPSGALPGCQARWGGNAAGDSREWGPCAAIIKPRAGWTQLCLHQHSRGDHGTRDRSLSNGYSQLCPYHTLLFPIINKYAQFLKIHLKYDTFHSTFGRGEKRYQIQTNSRMPRLQKITLTKTHIWNFYSKKL